MLIVMDIKNISQAIKLAVDDELSRDLSFGCVNYKSQGSHKDMTYHDFLASSSDICDAIETSDWDRIETFDQLRVMGREIEKKMYESTGGVNTYKGFIFLILILVYGLFKSKSFEEAPIFIKNFSHPLVNDYKKQQKPNHYKKLGIKDVRSFPLSGFKEIFDLSLAYEKEQMTDEILTLILLARIDDTTTLARSNLKTLKFLQNQALNLYKAHLKGINIDNKLEDLNDYYLKNNISSGGVADIFTLTKTIYYLRRLYE